ncbi:hypothetical protein BO85DRAFT_471121 [Aspergillus piperis CBS 112811]|uniref:Uncharacterized protein n=1 Tax=Aspergillus piperis CBS 112811 TaxID=1448313 RepID=A0A8G1QVB0_9EURO|nr:hypothetical protein BO85DRAFT_471121 [Aspergillus piperis CBS 112811]RAH54324.1 hypothetical protein BO85DRAFT_471121 [Aspergillus piperis CBS 112811]
MPPITRAQAKHKFPDFLPEASRTGATYQDLSDPVTRLFQPIFEQWDYRYYLTLRRSCPVERPQTEWLMLVQVSLINLSQTLGAAFDEGVFQTQYVGPIEYYKFMAVYFPEDLAGTHIKELNRTNPFNLGNLIGSDHGWLDQPVFYQGQHTLYLIYFLRWENSDREHEYKNFCVTINGKIIDYWKEFMTPLR